MGGALGRRVKRHIKEKAVALYRRVRDWEGGALAEEARKRELDLSGKLTPAMKHRLDGGDFLRAHGYSIRWDDPQSFNEKVMWGMLHYQNPLRVRCNDKFTVKGYVDEILGPGHTIPTYGWWTDPDDIDFSALPERFVLKVDWSGGGQCNLYVPDRAKLDEEAARRQLRDWLKPERNLYYLSFRWDAQFSGPVIFAEEYLEPEPGCEHPHDFKLCCYHGVCRDLFVSTDVGGAHYRNWFDRDWNPLPMTTANVPPAPFEIPRPARFDEMLRIAEKLSRPFPFMRIDLYLIGERILVGEMTFAYGSGLSRIDPRAMDDARGRYFDMPEFVNFDRLRESDPLPPERAFLLDGKISPEVTRREMERRFLTKLFYRPNLAQPRSLNEKLLWTVLHWQSPLASVLADRCEMRRFVAETVGERHLVPELGIYTDVNRIDWDALPERFAAKSSVNFGEDSVYLVRHKSCDSEAVFRATVGDWLLPWNSLYYRNACLPGRKAEPRILIEAWVGGEAKRLNEFRFYCARGEAKLACAVCERGTDRESHTFAEPDTWEALPMRLHELHKRPIAARPEKLAEMLRLCAALTRELPLARVDFFEVDGRVYIHNLGLDCALFRRIEPVEWDFRMGGRFALAEQGEA